VGQAPPPDVADDGGFSRHFADLHRRTAVPRSHGPPWECRLRRSASSHRRGVPRRTRSVPDGIPTQSVGTSVERGSYPCIGSLKEAGRWGGCRFVLRIPGTPCRSSPPDRGLSRLDPPGSRWSIGKTGPRLPSVGIDMDRARCRPCGPTGPCPPGNREDSHVRAARICLEWPAGIGTTSGST
jgi:hypothetical protein